MNKSEFINGIADEAGLTKVDAERAVDAMIQVVKKALKAGDSVSLMGFGTFAVRQRAARTGRNPQTGEPAEIKAANVPTFKAGKVLKDAVN
jgi:DNA-binding protein HU-beta